MNIMLENRVGQQLKNIAPLITAIIGLIMVFLIVVYPCGMNWYGNRAADRFVTLIQQGQYRQAELWYHKTCVNLPGPMGVQTSRHFRQKIEGRLELWTKDYLAGQLSKDLVESRIDALDQIGISPGNLSKCRNIIQARELADRYEFSRAGDIIKTTC